MRVMMSAAGSPASISILRHLRALGQPTIPTTLAAEKATNPFLRAASRELRESVGLSGATDVEVFAKTRALKDAF